MSLSVAIQHQLGALALDVSFDAPPGITALFGRSGRARPAWSMLFRACCIPMAEGLF